MSNPVVTNLIKTGAVVWVAPVAEANPDETTVDFGDAWGGNWARVGYTKEQLALAYESEEFDLAVEEVLAPVKRFRIGEGLTLETILAEVTAEYLQLAAGNQTTVSTTGAGAGQYGYEETGLGGVVALTEKKWGFEGLLVDSAGADQPIRVFVHKATAMLNGALEFSKKSSDYPGIPIQLKALADTSQSVGKELLVWQRVTAEKTS